MPTNGFSIKPLEVKLLAGEQKATEYELLFTLKWSQIVGIAGSCIARNRVTFQVTHESSWDLCFKLDCATPSDALP